MQSASWEKLGWRKQVGLSGIPISFRIFHSLLWSTVQGFSIVNEAEVGVFLELSCLIYDPVDIGNLISGSSAFLNPVWTSASSWFTSCLKPCLENFEHFFASVWDECNCAVVWTFFGIAFLWDWNENWPFPVLWPLLSFPDMLAYRVQHFHNTVF